MVITYEILEKRIEKLMVELKTLKKFDIEDQVQLQEYRITGAKILSKIEAYSDMIKILNGADGETIE